MVWKLGVVIVIGYILIGASMMFDQNRPPLDWRSAQWLPVYLIGLGIISWQGQYSGGPSRRRCSTPGTSASGTDMLIVAAFSLVIYFWAMASRAAQGGDDPSLVEAQSGDRAARAHPPLRRSRTGPVPASRAGVLSRSGPGFPLRSGRARR